MNITREMAEKVLSVVDKGLCKGVGKPIPGKMCLQEAVCYALGLPHSSRPPGVDVDLRSFEIGLNDFPYWSGPFARATGLRRIAIAQLGTAGTLDKRVFAEKLARKAITFLLPKLLRSVAYLGKDPYKTELLETASHCETEGTADAALAADRVLSAWAANRVARAAPVADRVARAARAAARVARADLAAALEDLALLATLMAELVLSEWAASLADLMADRALSEWAEAVVQILIEMKTPGSEFLYLTE